MTSAEVWIHHPTTFYTPPPPPLHSATPGDVLDIEIGYQVPCSIFVAITFNLRGKDRSRDQTPSVLSTKMGVFGFEFWWQPCSKPKFDKTDSTQCSNTLITLSTANINKINFFMFYYITAVLKLKIDRSDSTKLSFAFIANTGGK